MTNLKEEKPGRIRIGSRGSQLALWQANWVKNQIEKRHPGVEVEIIKIKTSGDVILDVPLAQVGGKGLFVKEIEEALLDNRIDLAVHSMKDVPVVFPDGLEVGIITEREDIRDAFISADGKKIDELPRGAVIGTSSLRRKSQLLHYRPDLEIVSIRGNVGTRLRKIEELNLAGTILAAAGLMRLGFGEKITELLPVSLSLPAIGQGALGIETRIGDNPIRDLISHLDDHDSNLSVRAERAFLKRLEGGCQVPIAAYGTRENGSIRLDGMVASINGERLIRKSVTGPEEDPEAIGSSLAEDLLSMGAGEILSEIYGSPLN